MMQPQSTLFRGPNEHVGPLKKDQCALTPKTCPLRKALRRGEGWGEGASDSRSTLAPSPDLLRFVRKSTSPRRGEVEQVARVFGTALPTLPHQRLRSNSERQRTRRAPSPLRGEGWGEGASDSRSTLAPSPDLLRFVRKSTSPRRGEVEQVARVIETALRRLPHQPPARSPDGAERNPGAASRIALPGVRSVCT